MAAGVAAVMGLRENAGTTQTAASCSGLGVPRGGSAGGPLSAWHEPLVVTFVVVGACELSGRLAPFTVHLIVSASVFFTTSKFVQIPRELTSSPRIWLLNSISIQPRLSPSKLAKN